MMQAYECSLYGVVAFVAVVNENGGDDSEYLLKNGTVSLEAHHCKFPSSYEDIVKSELSAWHATKDACQDSLDKHKASLGVSNGR